MVAAAPRFAYEARTVSEKPRSSKILPPAEDGISPIAHGTV
jgi:hypothetical protein